MLAPILHFLNCHNFVIVVVQLLRHVWLWPHELQLTRLPCPSLSPRVSNFVVSLNNFNLQELLYINSSDFVAFLTNCDGHSRLLVFCMNLEISLSFSPKEKLKGIFTEIRFKNLRGDKEIWGWLTLTMLSFPNHWHNTSLHSYILNFSQRFCPSSTRISPSYFIFDVMSIFVKVSWQWILFELFSPFNF